MPSTHQPSRGPVTTISSLKAVVLNGIKGPLSVLALAAGFARWFVQFFFGFPALLGPYKLPDYVSSVVHVLVGYPLVIF